MENLTETPKISAPPRPRLYFSLGVLIFSLGMVTLVVQYFGLKRLNVVPWYLPVLGTAGVALMVLSVVQRPRVWRILGLTLFVLLTGMEWFLILGSKLPEYQGPAKVAATIPAFTTTLADGTSFSDQDLQKGNPTVLLFFRGHW
jgi:hypothetical protein